MKERPILFQADMVNAILSSRKTQTRRIVKPTKDRNGSGCHLAPCEIAGEVNGGDYGLCPYGQPGDRLWVREAHRFVRHEHGLTVPQCSVSVQYRATKNELHWKNWKVVASCTDDHLPNGWLKWDDRIGRGKGFHVYEPARWRPSIHMPRWASRITLEIVSVRVERLNDISEADAKAEGVNGEDEAIAAGLEWFDKPRRAFRFLWQSINGAGSWDANPWVWVVEFKRVENAA